MRLDIDLRLGHSAWTMPRTRTWCSGLLLAWLAATGCQQGNPPASGTASSYGQDLEHICNSEARSGALDHPEGQRSLVVAQWLGSKIETEEGRAFLARLRQAPAEEKAALLREEAGRNGLSDCPLARSWGD
jgi:hypothetical protein